MKDIAVNKKYELFKETIESCGMFLLNMDEEEIEYKIFEEFDSGRISFLHENTLDELYKANLISKSIVEKSIILRKMTEKLEGTKHWNSEEVRTSELWRQLLSLSDEIKKEL